MWTIQFDKYTLNLKNKLLAYSSSKINLKILKVKKLNEKKNENKNTVRIYIEIFANKGVNETH